MSEELNNTALFILKDIQQRVTSIQESQDEANKLAADQGARVVVLEQHRRDDAAKIRDQNDRLIKLETRFGPMVAGLVIFFSAGISMAFGLIRDLWPHGN